MHLSSSSIPSKGLLYLLSALAIAAQVQAGPHVWPGSPSIHLSRRDVQANVSSPQAQKDIVLTSSNQITETDVSLSVDPSLSPTPGKPSHWDILLFPDNLKGSPQQLEEGRKALSNECNTAQYISAITDHIGDAVKGLFTDKDLLLTSSAKHLENYQKTFKHITNTQEPQPDPPKVEGKPYVPRARSMEMIMRYAQYSAISYCWESSARQMSGVQVQEVPGNSLLLGEFEILRWYFVSDMKYYVAVNHKQRRLVVSIRGSVGVENYYRDALMHGVTPSTRYWPGAPTDSKVHTGFYTAAYMMLDEERPETRVSNIISYHLGQFPGYGVVITGHSLGAAVASLVALSLKLNPVQGVTSLELYTYGQPIVSNAIFADFLGEKLGNDVYVRSISSDDSVPYLQMNAWSLQEPKDTMRHPKQSDEVFFPRWYEPVAQLCHGMSDPLCSLNMYCKDRKWDRHSWLGGQRIGEGFCLLSKYPQVIKP